MTKDEFDELADVEIPATVIREINDVPPFVQAAFQQFAPDLQCVPYELIFKFTYAGTVKGVLFLGFDEKEGK